VKDDDAEIEDCMHCGVRIRRGLNYWHHLTSAKSKFCRGPDGHLLRPLQRAKPAFWSDAE
jgi:hypothetical protein